MFTDEYVYKLTDPFTMEVRYIGRTIEPLDRLRAHIYQTHGGSDKDAWIIDLRNVGAFPIMEIIEQVISGNGPEREKFWIKHYQRQGSNLLNVLHNKPDLKIIGYIPRKRKATDKVLADCIRAIFNLPEGVSPIDRWVLISLINLCKGEEIPYGYTLRSLAKQVNVSTAGLSDGALKRLQDKGLLTFICNAKSTLITVHINYLLGDVEDGENHEK